jgi:putative IMPACT (imprinted ancient) family translation regulator
LDFVTVAVVRFYGGVNLGAGGLVRAYGGAAAEVLRIAPKLEIYPRVTVNVLVGFELVSTLHNLLEKFDLQAREDEFTDQGLNVKFAALETDLETLQILVRDATRGQGVVSLEGV